MPEPASGEGARRLRVLYLVYWGAAEPLGQSLVLPAVRCLAGFGVEPTLVTFEKPADLQRPEEMDRIRRTLAEARVAWVPLRYHKRPKWPATLWDALMAVRVGVALRSAGRIDVVHARTFVAGVMGLVLAPLIGARLVFHNEGFYPDEQVDGGFWKYGSWPHRLARRLEGWLYDRADGLVVLSRRARAVVEARPAVRARGTPVLVVPSCVDLEHFGASPTPAAPSTAGGVRLVYLGSIGGRYRFDQVGPFAAAVRRLVGRVHVRVLTPTSPAAVAAILRAGGLESHEFSVDHVPHTQVPRELAQEHAGLFLLTRGLSEHACSPTKIGEYWAAGLPVVTSPNVSDTEQIIRSEGVGVVVEDLSESAYQQAARELVALLGEPGLASRCRRAAEVHYSLETAGHSQHALYSRLCGSP